MINRVEIKMDAKVLVRTARVSPIVMTAIVMAICFVLDRVVDLVEGGSLFYTYTLNWDYLQASLQGDIYAMDMLLNNLPASTASSFFFSTLVSLFTVVLNGGYYVYCIGIRRGAEMPYATLLDGLSVAGKLIWCWLQITVKIFLWSMLFVIPGIIAAYRYRFALYNLYENPGIGVMEALDMSKRQTWGYKSQIFALDWSYFGWLMLASLPLLAVLFLLYRLVFQIVTGPMPALPAEELVDQALVLPVWVWSLIASVFSLVVGLFYVPNRECVELGYFEIAKRTSGVGWNAAPPRSEDNPNSGWTGGWGQM